MKASISSSLQIALSAVLALAAAQALQLPDAYWAPISAIVCSLEAFDRAFETARRRLIGTLLGVGLAAVQVSFVQQSLHHWMTPEVLQWCKLLPDSLALLNDAKL